MINRTLCSILLALSLSACSLEERPDYGPLINTLPSGGPTLEYNPDTGLDNVDAVTANLEAPQTQVFMKSLDWYGTESTFGLERLDGLTAKRTVEVVNCLKAKTDDQSRCF